MRVAAIGSILVATFDDQRCPVGDLFAVLAVVHAVVAMVRRHRLVTRSQEFNILLAPHEAHVRARVNEGARIGDRSLLDQVRPELARQVELNIDLERPGDVDAAVGALRGVIQLAVRSMAGAGVVPRLRAFLRAIIQRFQHGDGERRVELFQHRPERRAHDAGADQNDVGCAGDGALRHGPLPCWPAMWAWVSLQTER